MLLSSSFAAEARAQSAADDTPPEIEVISPNDTFVGDVAPEIIVGYSDDDSGVDLTTLAIKLDGTDLTPSCTVEESSAACVPPDLSEGNHTIDASIRDREGNGAAASFTFTVDISAPRLSISVTGANPGASIFADGFESGDLSAWGGSGPLDDLVSNDATPEIVLSYSDAVSAIDLAAVSIEVDGFVLDCDFGPETATCQAPSLSEGEHEIVATVTDLAGNSTTETVNLVIDVTPPLVIPVAEPPANEEGWHSAPVTVKFECSDALSGVVSCSRPVVVAEEGAGQEVTGTAVDLAGNSASASLAVNIDLTPPEILAFAEPPANEHGWHSTPVTVRFECSDALSGVESCPESVSLSEEGAGQAVGGRAFDVAGNPAEATLIVNLDLTPPEIIAFAEPPANEQGWHATPVTVRFECFDTLSGVLECPDSVVLNEEGAGQEASGRIFDLAGNQANVTLVVNLDLTPPGIIATADPPANAAGWHSSPVTVTFDCQDDLSGVVSCPEPVILSEEGAGQEVSGTVSDLAGNLATATLVADIDLTPPEIFAIVDPPPNPAGWHSSPVTVAFECRDTLSGIVSCPEPVTLSEEGAEQEVSGTVFDVAGNSATVTSIINIDLTPPVIVAIADPPPNPAGWYSSVVTVTFECTDRLSRVATCPEPVVLSEDGVGQEVSGTVFDLAGNSATATLVADVDLTPPEIVAVAEPQANAFGWHSGAVTVRFECADALSGLASCPGPVTLSNEGADQEVSGRAFDVAGNLATATLIVNIDTTPPSITATADPPANVAGWHSSPVTVTFDCSDALSGVANCPEPVALSEEGIAQEVMETVADLAGNLATVTLVADIDLTPPEVVATVDPPPNAAGWHSSAVTVTFVCSDALSGVASCPETVTVNSEGADQVIPGVGFDVAGNSAQADTLLSIDLSPPVFDSAEFRPPQCPAPTSGARPQVRACFEDLLSGVESGTVLLSVDGVDRTADAVVSGDCIAWDPPVALVSGEHDAEIAATDAAGNAGSADWCFLLAAPPLLISIDSPEDGFLTLEDTVDVSGTVDENADTVTVNGMAAVVGGGTFQATDVPLREGRNLLTAVAAGPDGAVGTASVVVVRDTTAPTVMIETPRDGAVLTALQVDVAGLVNDIITGTTINADDCDVTVNGVEATVANRSFVVSDLLLKRGVNTITAEARDRLGNSASTEIQVTVQDQVGQRILLLAGNSQSAEIFEELSDPMIVALEDANGDAVIGRPVTFTVSRGEGTVRAFPQEGSSVTVLTDEVGLASATFQLSGRSGAGNNRVVATAPGFLGEVEFCFNAQAGPAQRITTLSGQNQRGVAERELPLPLVAVVTDAGGNPVAGVDVTFEVLQGGGSLDGSSTLVRTTDLDGLIDAIWTLGPDEGINNNTAQASFAGLLESAASFSASGQFSGEPAATSFSGVVLDNQDNPIDGVTVEIAGTSLMAVTDDQGQFSIGNVPVGSIQILVDGTTTSRPGEWPHLEFDLTTVAGRDNDLGMPIYLLPLDVDNSAVVGGNGDVTLFMDNIPGAELTVFADSVTCPDGSSSCEVSFTQVRGERVPMAPPLGSSFMLAWTIQPAGTHFDPPARICIPNSAMPPGQQVEIFSFDHDLADFVAVGTATVTGDGAQICSDPGFGVVKSGWGGCVPPPPPCTEGGAGSCDDNDNNACTERRRVPLECGFTCEPVDTEGRSCDDKDKCTVMDVCMGSQCGGEEIDVQITDAPVAVCVGTTKTATATITPPGRSIAWTSGDPSKLAVSGSGSSASLTGVATGSFFFRTVKVTAEDGATSCSSDAKSIEVIERDDFTGIFTVGEKTWCAVNSPRDPLIAAGCLQGYLLGQEVLDWEMMTFPSRCRGEGSPADAARHARWSCELHSNPLVTSHIADQILRRHENGRDDPCESHEQDLNNNAEGRSNAATGQNCTTAALADLAAGRLQVNNPVANCP